MPLINFIKADITELRSQDIETIIKFSENKYGPIEMIICCAAMSKPAMFLSRYFNKINKLINE